MSDNYAPATIGDNSGDLVALIEAEYSPIRLAATHDDLALEVQGMAEHAGRLTVVDDPQTSETAAQVVINLRALIQRVDERCAEVAKPVFTAHRNVTAFFNGLNNSDPKKPGRLTAHKLRIERLVRDHAFHVAEQERERVRKAAEAERTRLAAEAEAARLAEEANKPVVAAVLMDQAVKTEAIAEKLDARAEGPVQELARQRTDSGTVGLRGHATFEVTDQIALRASLGVLGDFFTADQIGAAIRAFQAAAVKAQRVKHAEEIIGGKRAMEITPPLAGVEFLTLYSGSVRA